MDEIDSSTETEEENIIETEAEAELSETETSAISEAEESTPPKEEAASSATPSETFESFFGSGTEEEQLRIKEIAAKLNIRDNDALWTIVYVLNYFGRFYRDLPQQIRKSADASVSQIQERCSALADAEMNRVKGEMGAAVIQHADELAKRRGIYAVTLPLAWFCCGIFVLSLLMFIAGVAVAGKGWGTNPFDAFLAAPAGWILPIAVSPLAGYSIFLSWNSYLYTSKKKHLAAIAGALIAIGLAVLCLLRTF